MNLRFTFLGYEYASVRLDIEHHELPTPVSILERGVKAVSRSWVKRMVAG